MKHYAVVSLGGEHWSAVDSGHHTALLGRQFDRIVWLRPPSDESRKAARERLYTFGGIPSDEMIATRLPDPDFIMSVSPRIYCGEVSPYKCEFSPSLQAPGGTTYTFRISHAGDEAYFHGLNQAAEPEKGTRLSTWLAHNLVPVLPIKDVEELLAACLARRLST